MAIERGRSVGWAAVAAAHVDPKDRPLAGETPTQTKDRLAAEQAAREREALIRYGLLEPKEANKQETEETEKTQ